MSGKIFRIIATGGLGDVLLGTPSFKALKNKYPDCKIVLFCHDKERRDLFINNPHVDQVRDVSFIHNPISFSLYYLKWAKFKTYAYGSLIPSFYNKKAQDIIADLFDVTLEDRKIQLFLTEDEEKKAKQSLSGYRNPIVIHISSRFSSNQDWALDNWNHLVASMPGYTFIQLGLPHEHQVAGAIDLRGKTSFREAVALMKNAKSFAGVNSSFAHATNAFGIRGVVLFGPANPEVWGHPNNINIYKKMRCAPCVDLLMGIECPYGKTCMDNITVEEVRNSLLKQMEGKEESPVKADAFVLKPISL
jgi:ADP-heptose:LPS heptosyltransferase